MARQARILRPTSDAAQRRAARVMLTVSVVGVIVSLLGAGVAWVVLGQINTSTRDTIDVSIESLDAIEQTLTSVDGVLDSTIESVDAVESTLDTVVSSVATGTDVVDSVRELSASAGPAFAEAEATLRELEDIGTTIDDVLDTVSSLPFGPNYDPNAAFGATLGELADEIAPLPGFFAQSSESLQEFSGSSSELEAEVETLAESVGEIGDRLRASPNLVDQYGTSIVNARQVALQSRQDLSSTLSLARVLVVLLGVTLAVGQLVPFWYGRELLLAASESD